MQKLMTATAIADTRKLTRSEWLELRRTGIGGSDAAGILGMNPYLPPIAVYYDKLGILPEAEDNEAMRQGRDFEQYCADRFIEAMNGEGTPKKVTRCNQMLAHPENRALLANIDRRIVGEPAGLECKTTSILNKTDFESGDIPPAYYIQCQHYMMVTGAEKWYLAVLIYGRRFHWFEVERCEPDIDALMKAELDFWNDHVLAKTPPPLIGVDKERDVLAAVRRDQPSEESIFFRNLNDQAQRLVQVKELRKQLEAEEGALENEFKLQMTEHNADAGRTGEFNISWKTIAQTRVDSKALKAKYPKIYGECSKTVQSRRFIIDNKQEAV